MHRIGVQRHKRRSLNTRGNCQSRKISGSDNRNTCQNPCIGHYFTQRRLTKLLQSLQKLFEASNRILKCLEMLSSVVGNQMVNRSRKSGALWVSEQRIQSKSSIQVSRKNSSTSSMLYHNQQISYYTTSSELRCK